jgi:epsilon-lactone hydrolase
MSKQQLAHLLEIAAQNPPPMNAAPPVMRAWAEGVTSHTPLADHVAVSRSSLGPYPGDLILPEGGDASRLIIYYHGGGFFLFSAHTYRVTTTNWPASLALRSSRRTIDWRPRIPPRPRTTTPSGLTSGR